MRMVLYKRKLLRMSGETRGRSDALAVCSKTKGELTTQRFMFFVCLLVQEDCPLCRQGVEMKKLICLNNY